MRIHCYACPAAVPVSEQDMAGSLRSVGWELARGRTYCPSCGAKPAAAGATAPAPDTAAPAPAAPDPAEAAPAPTAKPPGAHPPPPPRPVVGARRAGVIAGGVLSAVVALLAIDVLYQFVAAVRSPNGGLRAGVVMIGTALVAECVWAPILTWRAANWLARLGLTVRCPACGEESPVRRVHCECGQPLRKPRDLSARLVNRPHPRWPVRFALVAAPASFGLVFLAGGLISRLGVSLSFLAGVGLVDVCLLAVALGLASRIGPPRPEQFGLRRTPLPLAMKSAVGGYAATVGAAAVYVAVFGPFTASATGLGGVAEPLGTVLGAVLLAPVVEELFFRGFIYGTLRTSLARWESIAFTSTMFVAAHWLLSHYPGWALVPIGLFSVASCLVYERTGSIWPCIALHAAYNASLFASPLVAGVAVCAVAAATAVILRAPGPDDAGPGRWLVPAVAAAACVALLLVAGAFHGSSPASASAVPGESGASRATPVLGRWAATGVTVQSAGYSNQPGDTIARQWEIDRTCTAAGCALILARQTAEAPLTAQLTPSAQGWVAVFPAQPAFCQAADGTPSSWLERTAWLIRFSDGGQAADAVEQTSSYSATCGSATSVLRWHATALAAA